MPRPSHSSPIDNLQAVAVTISTELSKSIQGQEGAAAVTPGAEQQLEAAPGATAAPAAKPKCVHCIMLYQHCSHFVHTMPMLHVRGEPTVFRTSAPATWGQEQGRAPTYKRRVRRREMWWRYTLI